jgi:hypothetical protein
MNAAARLIKRLLDVVVDAELDRADDDFVDAALALASLAISRLPPQEREQLLSAIEDGGLRREVQKYPGARSSPYPKTANGNGHDAY